MRGAVTGMCVNENEGSSEDTVIPVSVCLTGLVIVIQPLCRSANYVYDASIWWRSEKACSPSSATGILPIVTQSTLETLQLPARDIIGGPA